MNIPENRDVRVHISLGTIIKTLLAIGFFVLVYLLRDVVMIVLTAIVIASAVEPATLWFERRKIPRLLGVIIVYAILIVCLSALFYFILPTLITDTAGFLANIDRINLTGFFQYLGMKSGVDGAALSSSFSFKDVIASLTGALTNISGGFLEKATSVFGGALSFAVIFVLSFYLAVQQDGVSDFLKVIVPIDHQHYVVHLWKRSQKKIGLWMQGQLLLGLLVGILDYLGLSVLGVPHALVLAVLAACFEIIPLFGPVLAAVPGIAIAFSTGGVTLGLVVAGLYLIVQQFESNLIYPLVVNKFIGMSPVLVIIALLVGAKLAGLLGAILSVPLASALMEYFKDVEQNKRATLEKV